jgi:hypothetical protein
VYTSQVFQSDLQVHGPLAKAVKVDKEVATNYRTLIHSNVCQQLKKTSKDIDEPIKHMMGQEPLKCKFVICRKD